FAEKLTAQLLAFARKQRLHQIPTNLNELVLSTAAIAERTLGENVTIVCDCAPDIKLVSVDVVQVNVALINLA
ncbi:hypothetical protein ACPC50_23755, partial [Bacillus subtilis]